jgi:hypothetical protein
MAILEIKTCLARLLLQFEFTIQEVSSLLIAVRQDFHYHMLV